MKQRILSFLLILCLLVGTIPQLIPAAAATDTAYSGTCGANLTWTLDTETGILNITGTGDMYDGDYVFDQYLLWYEYRADIQTVIMEHGITSIGDLAFYGCTNLTSVTIPDSVTSIGANAFEGCTALTSVTIPDNVTSIGWRTFYGCTELTTVSIPASVTSIASTIFAGCKNLQSIQVDAANQHYTVDAYGVLYNKEFTTLIVCPAKYVGSYVIPDSVITVSDNAFMDCVGLSSVTILGNVKTIDDYAFYNCTNLSSVTISDGATNIGDYAFYNCTSLTSVAIPDGATDLGDYAFYNCTNLTSVTISDSVTYINEYTFYKCTSLASVTIPDSVISIDNYAFYYCEALTSVTIPDNVAYIGAYAFRSCDGLTSVTIPGSVTSIGQHAFDCCFRLSSVTISDGVTSIGDSAFNSCHDLTSVTLPDSVTDIGRYAFDDCFSLAFVTIPDSLTAIDSDTFRNCSALTSVVVPNSVTSVGDRAFYGCKKLNSLYFLNPSCEIYDSQSTISMSDTGVIYGFPGSTAEVYAQNYGYTFRPLPCQCDVSLHEHTTEYVAPTCVNGGHYLVCKECDCSHLISSAPAVTAHNYERTGTLESTCVQEGVATYTCSLCGGTKTETIPVAEGEHTYEVTFTVSPTCGQDGEITYTCADCGSIKTEIIPAMEHHPSYYTDNGTHHSVICEICSEIYTEPHIFEDKYCICGAYQGDFISGKCGDRLTWILDTRTNAMRIFGTGPMSVWEIDDNVCWNEYYHNYPWEIQSVKMEYGITSISDNAFEHFHNLASVTIPDSVVSIGEWAFSGCASLPSITLPASVTQIGDNAFFQCDSLQYIYVDDANQHFSSINGVLHNKDATVLIYCPDAYLGDYTISSNVITIGEEAFRDCEKLSSVTIPNSVTSIEHAAFLGCDGLTSVVIPDNVTFIDTFAFYSCTNLCSVSISDSISTISDYTFAHCTGLTSVTIPNSIISVGDYAFADCTVLTSITIPDSVTSIGNKAFDGCTALTSVTLSNSITSIDYCTFNDCSNLTSVTIPDSVTSINVCAFSCTGLTSVTIPANVTYIGHSAFYNRGVPMNIYILNPTCEICDVANTLDKAVIYGYPDSTAEAYAQKYGNTFYPLCQCEDYTGNYTEERVEATCTEDGFRRLVCSDCDYHYTRTLPATGHSYEVTSTVATTCDQDGQTTSICIICGHTKTETVPTEGHSYEILSETAPNCTWTGLTQYTCTICGHTKDEVIPATGHSYDDGAITTPATCVSKGVRVYTCTVCGSTKVESIPVTGHQHLLYRNNGDDHSVKCITCPNSYSEPHRFVDGHCICGAIERILDETVKIYHSLNLASDIAINYAVRATDLAGYESYYMECVMPIYEENELLGTEAVTIQPVLQGDFYYFTLTGMTALEMNNMVEATLHMEKDGKHYISNTDSYSIATYAYDQLNNEAMPEPLRALCANLLRYGAKAQLWKGYRTDALADAAMTEEHKALLDDLESVPFGNNSQILTDIENPVVTWVGKTMSLDSKITVRFVVNTTNYTGDLNDLSLRISFVNINGETETVNLTELTAYNAARNYYAFDFDGLLSAELRSVLRATVYAGDTQLSPTLVYSVDTYGTATTGSLRTLVQAMVAYGDSANEFFAG